MSLCISCLRPAAPRPGAIFCSPCLQVRLTDAAERPAHVPEPEPPPPRVCGCGARIKSLGADACNRCRRVVRPARRPVAGRHPCADCGATLRDAQRVRCNLCKRLNDQRLRQAREDERQLRPMAEVERRYRAGESLSVLAAELCLSRQALERRRTKYLATIAARGVGA